MTRPVPFRIVAADVADAPAIHALQMRSFEPEARACQVLDIPPLQETQETVREHIRTATVLKALDGDRLVGSIRGIVSGESCLIRALMVAPEAQGRGLGALLLQTIEQAHPHVARFDLTTNMIMTGNVRFYLRHGYAIVEQQQFAPTIRLAFFRRLQSPGSLPAVVGAG